MPIRDIQARIETPRLILRALKADDRGAVYAYASDAEVTRYTVFERHASMRTTDEWLGSVLDSYRAGQLGPWAIEMRAHGRVIGTCGFHVVDELHRRGDIGYALAREYWGHGYATEAVRAMIEFGFEHLNLNRIEARAVPANVASTRVMQKAGMKYEGILSESGFFKGAYQDVALYSILRSDGRAPGKQGEAH
jgi:ribosomal-protein-alanine N-acetyltransferase